MERYYLVQQEDGSEVQTLDKFLAEASSTERNQSGGSRAALAGGAGEEDTAKKITEDDFKGSTGEGEEDSDGCDDDVQGGNSV